MPQTWLKMDNSHISDHFRKGSPNTHAISQEIHYGGKTSMAYTDVRPDGTVGQSGFVPKSSSK